MSLFQNKFVTATLRLCAGDKHLNPTRLDIASRRAVGCTGLLRLSNDLQSFSLRIRMPMQPQSPTAYSLTSLQQDLPDEFFAWDFSRDVLGGLDQFVDPASSLESSETPETDAAEASQTAAEPAGPSSSDTAPPVTATSRPRSGSAGLRKQRQNRLAQQRYRQRQKVTACSNAAKPMARFAASARPLLSCACTARPASYDLKCARVM